MSPFRPIVSVFIPIYNGEKYLSQTLDSLLEQTYKDFEIIIVNDGSTDRTQIISEQYASKDNRIRIVSHDKNKGLSAARNTGYSSSNPLSKYLMNHDSDDISLPTKLEKLVAFLESNQDIAAVGTFAEYFDDQGNFLGKPPIEWKPEAIKSTFGEVNSMIVSATLVRREMLDNIAPFRKEYGGCDDYDFWSRALIAGYKLANIPEVLHKIRLHSQSIGATQTSHMEQCARKIRENYKTQTALSKNPIKKENSHKAKNLKLHLGCGNIKIPGFINIDIDPKLSAVDVVDNVKELNNFTENSTSVIYACHILEHFAHDEILPILRRWHEVLEPGGELRISVPDMDRIVKVYYKNWGHFQTPPNTPWIGLIYGGQEDQYDFHKTGFNFTYLKYLLEQAGFVDIEEYPHSPHWLGIQDASLANEPFKEYISLNIKAKKPQPSLNIEKSRKVSLSILHTVEFFHPHVGGAETVVQQISERLAKRGHHVEIATTKLPDRNFQELNGVVIHEFDVAGNLATGFRGIDIQRYRDFLCNHAANVAMNYAAQQWATDLAFSALEKTKGGRINIIAPCGYSALQDARTIRWPQFTEYFNKIIPIALPLYDAAIYHSSIYKDYEFAMLHGFQNSVVIPNGVDEEEFTRNPTINFREKYNIMTSFLGLCVANFYKGKGHDRLIEAVRQMNRPDFSMVFIGKDGGELIELQKQAQGLNIYFLVNIPREDTVSAYHTADIFLFGSYIEASPLVIIEAKASKTPFVSTDCGNVKEWKGGIVCSPEEIADNANRLLNNESSRKQLAEEGYREWKEKLTWKAIVDQYEDLYLRLHSAKSRKIPQAREITVVTNASEENTSLHELRKDFRNISALIRLAEIEMKRANHIKARNYLIAAQAVDPDNAEVQSLLNILQT